MTIDNLKDVQPEDGFYSYVRRCVDLGLLKGIPQTLSTFENAARGLQGAETSNFEIIERFQPEKSVTRGEVAKILTNLGLRLNLFTINTSTVNGKFSDVPEGNGFFPYIQTLRNVGIASTDRAIFEPDQITSLGVFCAYLNRFLQFTPLAENPTLRNLVTNFSISQNCEPKFVNDVQRIRNLFIQSEIILNGNVFADRVISGGVFDENSVGPTPNRVLCDRPVTRSEMAKILANFYRYLSLSGTNQRQQKQVAQVQSESNDLRKFSVIGEKFETTAVTEGAAPLAPDFSVREMISGDAITIGAADYTQDTKGNPVFFYWTSSDGTLQPMSANFSQVRFTAPVVQTEQTVDVYRFIGNTKGKAKETFVTIRVRPRNSSTVGSASNPIPTDAVRNFSADPPQAESVATVDAAGNNVAFPFRLTNDGGTAPITCSVEVRGANYFLRDPDQTVITIQPNAAEWVVVEYRGNGQGVFEGKLLVSHNSQAQASPLVLPMKAFVLPPAQPIVDISLTPDAPMDFGTMRTGESTPTRTITLSNLRGSAETLRGRVSLDNPNFVLEGGNDTFEIPPGQSLQYRVRFAPQAGFSQTMHDALRFDFENATVRGRLVSLTGTPQPSVITASVSAPTLDLRQVTIGEWSEGVFTIRNDETSNDALRGYVRPLETTSAFRITSGDEAFVLQPGESRDVRVMFSPRSTTSFSDVISIESLNATNFDVPTEIALTGTGVAPIQGEVDFTWSQPTTTGGFLDVSQAAMANNGAEMLFFTSSHFIRYNLGSRTWRDDRLPSEMVNMAVDSYVQGSSELHIFTGTHIVTYRMYPSSSPVVRSAPIPTPRTGAMMASYGNRIFVIGGRLQSGALTGVVEEYSPNSNVWSSSLSMPTPRERGGAIPAGDGIYVMGGFTSTGSSSSMEFFNPVLRRWIRADSMSLMPQNAIRPALFLRGQNFCFVSENGAVHEFNIPAARLNPRDPQLWRRLNSLPTPANGRVTAISQGATSYLFTVPRSAGAASSVYEGLVTQAKVNPAVSSPVMDFGNIAIGSSADMLVNITNLNATGTLTGTVMATSLPSSLSIVFGAGNTRVLPGENSAAGVVVRFSPKQTGRVEGTISFTPSTGDRRMPIVVTIRAFGVSPNRTAKDWQVTRTGTPFRTANFGRTNGTVVLGNRAYTIDDNVLRVVDTETLNEVQTIVVTSATFTAESVRPTAIVGDGIGRLYVSMAKIGGNAGEGMVAVIDANAGQVLRYIPAGEKPSDIALYRGNLYVANDAFQSSLPAQQQQQQRATITVINTTSFARTATIPVGTFNTKKIAIDPVTGKGYVSRQNDVAVFDANTNTFIRSIPMDGSTDVLAVAGNKVYASVKLSGGGTEISRLDIIDIGSNTKNSSILLGNVINRNASGQVSATGITPGDIAATPNFIFVTIFERNIVQIIDVESGSVIGTFPVEVRPLGVAADAVRNRVYITNSQDKTISLLMQGSIPANPGLAIAGRNEQSQTPTIQWQGAARADNYTVEIADDPQFRNILINSTVPSTQFTVPGTSVTALAAEMLQKQTSTLQSTTSLQRNSRYFVRVNGRNVIGTGRAGADNFATIPFTPPVPTLLLPTTNAEGVQVSNTLLIWETPVRTATYQVQVSPTQDFRTLALDRSNVRSSSLPVRTLSANTRYFWRVRSTNAGGTSAWSSVSNFFTGRTGTAPFVSVVNMNVVQNQSTSGTVRIADSNPASVQLVAVSSTLRDMVAARNISLVGTGSTRTLVIEPTYGLSGTAVVTLTFRNGSGLTTSASLTLTVRRSLTAIIPIAPTDGAVLSTTAITFTWTTVANVRTYQYQVAYNPVFNPISFQDSSLTRNQLGLQGFGLNRRLYWRVRARLQNGVIGEWSRVSDFIIDLDTRLAQAKDNGSTLSSNNDAQLVQAVSPQRFAMQNEQESAVSVLLRQYPNPFSHTTTLEYLLPREAHVRMDICNMLGQTLITPVNGIETAGAHTVDVTMDGFPSGVYVVRLSVGGQVLTRQMTLIR